MPAGLANPASLAAPGSRRISLLVAGVLFLQLLDSTIITTWLPVMAAGDGCR